MTFQCKYNNFRRLITADNNVNNNWDMGVGSENIYDANGNILRMKTGTLTKNYAYYTNTNKVKNTDGAGNDYVYDATGNMTQSVPKNINQLSYDKHIQMMKSITMVNNDKMFFTYDGTERRVLKKDKNNNQLYLYDGLNPIIENMNTRQNKEYVYGPTGVIAIKTDGQINWIIKDHLGSTRVVANMDNTVLASMDYAPYGSVIRYSGNSPMAYTFTGQEYDSTTGMWNFKARMYDSELAIFYSNDPAGQYVNPYSYCGNSPVVMRDEDGKFAWFIPVIIGAAVGAYTGASIQSKTAEFWNWKSGSWKGAITGAFVGAAAGAFIAPAIGATGMTTTTGGITVATKAWGTTTTILNSAALDIGFGAATGVKGKDLWKSGLTGAAVGGFAVTGGFGLVKHGFGGKLAYQALSTSGHSIGNNWARNKDLLSRVVVGVGPVNLTFGKNQSLLQARDNIGNIFFNSIGMANLLSGGKANFDWNQLSFKYSGGYLGNIYNGRAAATGAHAIIGVNDNLIKDNLAHESNHLWLSRSLSDRFLPNYFIHGLSSSIISNNLSDFWYRTNYFEELGYSNAWEF